MGEAALTFGDWLQGVRLQRNLTRAQLAELAGVSPPTVANIESGRTANPGTGTREKLQRALEEHAPKAIIEAADRESQVSDLGPMEDFDPHDDFEFPDVPGVYVLYDISQRPIYVGEGGTIKTRLRQHQDKFWYKRPLVETASFIYVKEEGLRKQLEQTLIKFLKSNAVINQQFVARRIR